MYARNLLNFVSLFVDEAASREGRLALDWNDELLARTVWPERGAAPVA